MSPDQPLTEPVLRALTRIPLDRALLVTISGIDGCGKGYVAAGLGRSLEGAGVRVAALGIDGWLNLPHVRFSRERPAEHFYVHAIRFEEMFERLVFPLRDRRSITLEFDFAEETATAYRPHVYAFEKVDVILLEGIYLLKCAFQGFYDLSVWIDCTFETALERAVRRAQEGLSPEETIRANRTIYFPAQEIHLELDGPLGAATIVFPNDPRLGGG